MANVNAGVHQGSILVPLLLVVYNNDLSDNLHCNSKLLFTYDTPLVYTIKKPEKAVTDHNNDLKWISIYSLKHKMSLSSDQLKQAQEVISRRKVTNSTNLQIFFNDITVCKYDYQKHLVLISDSNLIFNMYNVYEVCTFVYKKYMK